MKKQIFKLRAGFLNFFAARAQGQGASQIPILRSLMSFTLLVLLSLSACGRGCSKKEEALEWIPERYKVLFLLDYKKLSSLPSLAKLSSEATGEQAKRLRELAKGLDKILIALGDQGGPDSKHGLIYASGTLNEKEIISHFEEVAKQAGQEFKKESFEGYTLYQIPTPSSSDGGVSLTFLSSNQILWGELKDVKEALTLHAKKGASVTSNQELMALYQKRDPDTLLWGVGLLPSSSGQSFTPMPIPDLQGLKSFTLSIAYPKDLIVKLTGNAEQTSQAEKLVSLADSYKTMISSMAESPNPLLEDVLKGFQVNRKDKSVEVMLTLKDSTLQEIAKKAEEMKKQNVPNSESSPSEHRTETIPANPLD